MQLEGTGEGAEPSGAGPGPAPGPGQGNGRDPARAPVRQPPPVQAPPPRHEPPAAEATTTTRVRIPRRSRRTLALGAALFVALVALAYWLHSRRFENTDDAQVDANISNIGARVSGTVTKVAVIENQPVKAGDVLVEIDPTDLQVALAQAKAAVAQAVA